MPWRFLGPMLDAMARTVDAYVERTKHLESITTQPSPDRSGNGDETVSEEGMLYIDLKLEMLAAMEEKLRASRVRLLGIRNYSVTLAPINRLPMEVLAMIVTGGYEDSRIKKERHKSEKEQVRFCRYQDRETEEPDHGHFPTTFSHVCRRWREVALGTAKVWGHIVLKHDGSCEHATEWIRRSKTCDLALELSTMSRLHTPHLQRALTTIGPDALRATLLVVNVATTSHLVETLKHFIGHERPLPLKRLELSLSDTTEDFCKWAFRYEVRNVIKDTMKGLEHIHIRDVFLSLGEATNRQLKSLHLKSLVIPGGPLLDMLRESPELESLSLTDVQSQNLQPEPSIMLHRLKTFSLQGVPTHFTHFILAAFAAPALEQLTLSNYANDNYERWRGDQKLTKIMLDFIKILRPTSLRSFTLHSYTLGSPIPSLDKLLLHMPDLRDLHVGSLGVVNDSVLRAMTGPNRLVPKLERLWVEADGFSASGLHDLIHERNQPGSEWPIRTLMVKRCGVDGMSSEILQALTEKVERIVLEGNERWMMRSS